MCRLDVATGRLHFSRREKFVMLGAAATTFAAAVTLSVYAVRGGWAVWDRWTRWVEEDTAFKTTTTLAHQNLKANQDAMLSDMKTMKGDLIGVKQDLIRLESFLGHRITGTE